MKKAVMIIALLLSAAIVSLTGCVKTPQMQITPPTSGCQMTVEAAVPLSDVETIRPVALKACEFVLEKRERYRSCFLNTYSHYKALPTFPKMYANEMDKDKFIAAFIGEILARCDKHSKRVV